MIMRAAGAPPASSMQRRRRPAAAAAAAAVVVVRPPRAAAAAAALAASSSSAAAAEEPPSPSSSSSSPPSPPPSSPCGVLDAQEYAARLHFPPAPQIVFPHVDGTFALGDGAKERVDAKTVIDLLWPVVSEPRRRRIAAVVRSRTYSFLPVVEGTYDMGNISAVARSADAMGLGAMHVVATEGMRFKRSRRASRGACKWSDLWRWRADTAGALAQLKAGGFRILVARPSSRARAASETDLGGPRFGAPFTAVIFGNEQSGVSQEAVDAADGEIKVPMAGFSESLNVSVAASLVMAEAFRQRGGQGDLPPDQARLLTASYLLRAVQGRDMQWLAWLNPEQAREEAEEEEARRAVRRGWRTRLQANREARARASSEAAAATDAEEGEDGEQAGRRDGGVGSAEDALSAEEAAGVAAAIEELRRRSSSTAG